ncbi:unnamed protein product [Schistosoma rodhaini]|uniref:Protein kinase domain-containing protein n=2 Tax=Schistosoma rodhaini TaxID=6188 RepID=A0AA85G8S3_9TREM|nr:unnamed protein product [Schistosoma rodhaini]CAH8611024.1 unnamed protein product [Schistosoma rodhaini]
MSDDSDAFASADESIHISVDVNDPVKNYPQSNFKENIDNQDFSNPNILSKQPANPASSSAKKSNVVEPKNKTVRQTKLQYVPKKFEKVNEAPLNANSKTNLRKEITSVGFSANKNEKHNQQLSSFRISKKVKAPVKCVKSKMERVGSKEGENFVNKRNDFPVSNNEEQAINDDTNRDSKVSEFMTEQLPVIAGNINPITSFQLRSEIDRLSTVDSSTEVDFITSATSNILRGQCDEMSSLVVPGGVIQGNPSDDEVLKRGVERQSEEKSERKVILDTWNSVWNTSWTNDDDNGEEGNDNELSDGWEVDFPEESGDISESQSSNINCSLFKNLKSLESTDNSTYGSQISSSIEKRDVEQKTSSNNFSWGWSGLSSFGQQLTSSLQATSLNLVQGGVDVLELIGRKTMSVLAENDPGFNYTRKFLRPPNSINNCPNLSKLLREAYELHTSTESNNHKSNKQKCGDFTYQLECSRALLHLESLELVSEQASNQLHTRLDSLAMDTTDNDNLLEEIWTNLNLDEMENDDNSGEDDVDNHDRSTAATGISPTYNSYAFLMKKFKTKLPNNYNHVKHDKSDQRLPKSLSSRTVQLWCEITQTSDCLNSIYPNGRFLEAVTNVWKMCDGEKLEKLSIEEIYFQSISSLAQFTSAYLEYLHKFSECILVHIHKTDIDFVELSQILACFFRISVEAQVCLSQEFIKNIKSLHVKKSTEVFEQQEESNPNVATTITTQLSKSQYISNLLLECSNAQNYLKNASNLLIPVLQLACLNLKYPSTLLTQKN